MATDRCEQPGARLRALNEPQPADVRLGADGRPARVAWRARRGGQRGRSSMEPVECVLDTWYVDDAWWSDHPIRRLYHEVQLLSGVRLVLSWDVDEGRWFVQR